jgi:anti-sigma-K factor RskA
MKHSQTSTELQERALLFAIGALPENERREFVRHLQEDDCRVCIEERLEFQSAAQSLALGLPTETPSASVKARLMAQVRAEVQEIRPSVGRADRERRGAWYWTEKLVLAAAVVVMAITMTINSSLRSEIETLTTRVAELEGQAGRDRARLVLLTSPQVTVVNLEGQGSAPQARGRIFWSQSDRVWLFFIESLPPTPADRTYQLWFVPNTGNPVSAQVFNTNADGSAVLEIHLPAAATDFKAAAVTTEPAGGLPQPSGAFVLLGGV